MRVKKTGKYVEPQESVVKRNKRGREGGGMREERTEGRTE